MTPKSPPPDQPPDPAPTTGDPQELREVLLRLRIVLDDLVNGPQPAVSAHLQEPLREAWPQVRAAFDTLDGQVASPNHAPRLAQVGLSGPALRPKVSGFRHAFRRLLQGGAAFFRRNVRYLLSWGNTILGSLAVVIPVAEVIKEYKECIENDLAEQEADGESPSAPTPPGPA